MARLYGYMTIWLQTRTGGKAERRGKGNIIQKIMNEVETGSYQKTMRTAKQSSINPLCLRAKEEERSNEDESKQ